MNLSNSRYFTNLIEKNNSELQYMLDRPKGIIKEAQKVAEYILEERASAEDYSSYSYWDLKDALNNIDKEKYPVRLKILEKEVRNRNIRNDLQEIVNADLDEIKSENLKSSIAGKINLKPRFDVKFKVHGETIDAFEDSDESDFLIFLYKPKPFQEMIIEDSSIRLFVLFDASKYKYGFRFWYLDKYSKIEYESVLHGVSNDFATSFLRDFIEKGKKELLLLKWKRIKKTLIQAIQAYTSIALLVVILTFYGYSLLEKHLLLTTNTKDFIQSLNLKKEYLFSVVLLILIANAISDRHQILNIRKLSINEIIDTLTPYFLIPILILLLLYLQ